MYNMLASTLKSPATGFQHNTHSYWLLQDSTHTKEQARQPAGQQVPVYHSLARVNQLVTEETQKLTKFNDGMNGQAE